MKPKPTAIEKEKKQFSKDIEDIIYFGINNFDLNPLSRKMAKEITKEIRQYINESPEIFEGIYRGGRYYRKLRDGSYYSADAMVYLPDEVAKKSKDNL